MYLYSLSLCSVVRRFIVQKQALLGFLKGCTVGMQNKPFYVLACSVLKYIFLFVN
uniref:Uncharacterized protein n=1 Tax=Anguilla anguilla TaxID=7936 RepID=A0A0E9XE49_ANGAN